MLEKQPSDDVLKSLANGEVNFASEEARTDTNDDMFNPHLKRNQKFAFVFVCVLSVVFIGMSVYQISNALVIPFPESSGMPESPVVATNNAEATKPAEMTDAEKSALRAKDSDADGISDFDEIFVYATSAYLADSDSDTVSDSDEIKNGEDPNCPVGMNCFRLDEGINAIASGDAPVSASATGGAVDLSKIDPKSLRTLLLNSGKVTQEELDKLDDATILAVLQEAISANPELQKELLVAQQPATTEVPLNGEALTPAQVRELLKQQGVSDAEINQVDDETLMKMYTEALATAQAKEE